MGLCRHSSVVSFAPLLAEHSFEGQNLRRPYGCLESLRGKEKRHSNGSSGMCMTHVWPWLRVVSTSGQCKEGWRLKQPGKSACKSPHRIGFTLARRTARRAASEHPGISKLGVLHCKGCTLGHGKRGLQLLEPSRRYSSPGRREAQICYSGAPKDETGPDPGLLNLQTH